MEQLDKQEIASQLRQRLESFPLYNQDQRIHVHVINGTDYLRYVIEYGRRNIDEPMFTLAEIDPGVCSIRYFNIPNAYQRLGYGTQLFQILESFCREKLKCIKFQTNCGIARDFWEKLGFKEGKLELEKTLASNAD